MERNRTAAVEDSNRNIVAVTEKVRVISPHHMSIPRRPPIIFSLLSATFKLYFVKGRKFAAMLKE